MKLNKNILIIVLLIANVAMTATLIFNKGNRHNSRRGERGPEHDEIGWSPEQKAYADSIKAVYGDSMKNRFMEIRSARKAMLNAIDGTLEGDSTALEWSRQIGNMHTELNQLSISHFKKLSSITSPDKKDQLIEMMTSRGKKRNK